MGTLAQEHDCLLLDLDGTVFRGQQPTDGEYAVHDRLPPGVTLAGIPSGEGWICAAQAGDVRFTCRSSQVIAAGATSAARIEVPVAVSAAAAASGSVDNAVLVEGGGENPYRSPTAAERAAFEGNVGDLPVCDPAITQNACRVPTRVQLSAALSGTVWLELGNDDHYWLDAGDPRQPGWTVELVDPASGQAVRTATTGSDGRYRFDDVIPGVRWNLRFRDPDGMRLALAGLPGISVPAGLAPEDDLPVGVQLLAPATADDRLYRVGAALEALLEQQWGGPLLAVDRLDEGVRA